MLFGGIKVGQITAVRPASEDPTRIEIAFDVKTGTPINEKSTAQVGSVSLMSSPALSITTGSNDARRLGAREVVRSEEAVSLQEITRRVAGVAESAGAVMAVLQREIPTLTGEAQNVSCESQRDQRSQEPETNRAYPCGPKYSVEPRVAQDRANHGSDLRAGETR